MIVPGGGLTNWRASRAKNLALPRFFTTIIANFGLKLSSPSFSFLLDVLHSLVALFDFQAQFVQGRQFAADDVEKLNVVHSVAIDDDLRGQNTVHLLELLQSI